MGKYQHYRFNMENNCERENTTFAIKQYKQLISEVSCLGALFFPRERLSYAVFCLR